MTYMDEEERAGADIWDKLKPRRKPLVPFAPDDDTRAYVEGAQGATRPREAVDRPRPTPGRPPIIDDSRGPPPPAVPRPRGPHRWDMDRRVPPQWQRGGRPEDRTDWNGSDAIDPGQDPRDQKRMLDGAYQAGRSGDTGAQGSFPNTPFGRRQRAAYERGRREAARSAQR